mgnify:CR=1 FL=1
METVEVVIRLPKGDFNCIFDLYNGCKPDETSVFSVVLHSVANGTVLPKECGGLVEWGKVVDMVTEYVPDDDGSVGNTNLKDLLYEVENMERIIEIGRGDKNE